MDDIILPGGRPSKPVSRLSHNVAAKLSIVTAGDVRIVTEKEIMIPDAGEWILVSGPQWATVVREAMASASTILEAGLPVSERKARRRQRIKDRRN